MYSHTGDYKQVKLQIRRINYDKYYTQETA